MTSCSVKKSRGRTPAPSDHPSRPSFDRVKEGLKENIIEAPKDHKGAKDQVRGHRDVFKRHANRFLSQALIRDGYKCVVTGIYDATAVKRVDVMTAIDTTVHTELAHILPELTCFNASTSSPEGVFFMSTFSAAGMLISLRQTTLLQYWQFCSVSATMSKR